MSLKSLPIALVGFALALGFFVCIAPCSKPTFSQYMEECREIAKRDKLVNPIVEIKESTWFQARFEAGQSAEKTMQEWVKEWR